MKQGFGKAFDVLFMVIGAVYLISVAAKFIELMPSEDVAHVALGSGVFGLAIGWAWRG